MGTLVIGSAAARELLGPEFRPAKDFDTFSDVEFGSAFDQDSGTEKRVDNYWHPGFSDWVGHGLRYATLDEMYTIKISHSAWDLGNGSWEKHMRDAMLFQQHGAKLIPSLYRMLRKVWTEKHGTKRVSLAKEKGEFFADAVTRVYDHDSLHASVAVHTTYREPLYELYLKPGSTVDMDMTKVWSASKTTQLCLFLEEVWVTALERWVVPSEYRCSPKWAYHQALKKTIVSLTKGKSSLFMAENYSWYVDRANMDYVQMHRDNSDKLIKLEK